MTHPRSVLLGAQAAAGFLPVCDHYSGVEGRMRKSLQLQAELTDELGACVFDVTLDCEDGAPVGGEHDHAQMVLALAREAGARPSGGRVAVRLHAVTHPAFESDVATIVGGAAAQLCHVMIPKVESVADVARAVQAIDAAAALSARSTPLPVHVLLESPAAVHHAFDIAAHPRVQSVSFGLLDFVSAHNGAIAESAMQTRLQPPVADDAALGQFHHPLVVRAKLAIAAACHAHGKVPSHCVVTEFGDTALVKAAARKAARAFGFTRMWSIHPSQIRPIVEAMAPDAAEVERAAQVIDLAARAQWAPLSIGGQLQDRASYRYFWQVLERAHQTGCMLPQEVQIYFQESATNLVAP